MISIKVPTKELFDSDKNEFIRIKGTTLQLEHSLISLKKWEQKWHKPFLKKEDKTNEEILDYIRCMTISNVDNNVYYALTSSQINEIIEYIKDPMTATWFSKSPEDEFRSMSGSIITAEIVYYWMISLGIPMECEKWHLNSLFTLIKVIDLKNTPKKKMNQRDATAQRRALNAQRRAKYKSKG